MKTISQLGKQFGISRTALLYYDAAGLLKESSRTHSRYRLYDKTAEKRLELICVYRKAGLPLKAIKALLTSRKGNSFTRILEKRLSDTNVEIQELKNQQFVILALLRNRRKPQMGKINKEQWVKMFREAGLSETQMEKWHRIFEKHSPEGHQEFLEFLNIPKDEIKNIRQHSSR